MIVFTHIKIMACLTLRLAMMTRHHDQSFK